MNRAERRAQARQAARYVLTCGVCGREFENETETLGEIERTHYMRLHDTTYRRMGNKIQFNLHDRRSGKDRQVMN